MGISYGLKSFNAPLNQNVDGAHYFYDIVYSSLVAVVA